MRAAALPTRGKQIIDIEMVGSYSAATVLFIGTITLQGTRCEVAITMFRKCISPWLSRVAPVPPPGVTSTRHPSHRSAAQDFINYHSTGSYQQRAVRDIVRLILADQQAGFSDVLKSVVRRRFDIGTAVKWEPAEERLQQSRAPPISRVLSSAEPRGKSENTCKPGDCKTHSDTMKGSCRAIMFCNLYIWPGLLPPACAGTSHWSSVRDTENS